MTHILKDYGLLAPVARVAESLLAAFPDEFQSARVATGKDIAYHSVVLAYESSPNPKQREWIVGYALSTNFSVSYLRGALSVVRWGDIKKYPVFPPQDTGDDDDVLVYLIDRMEFGSPSAYSLAQLHSTQYMELQAIKKKHDEDNAQLTFERLTDWLTAKTVNADREVVAEKNEFTQARITEAIEKYWEEYHESSITAHEHVTDEQRATRMRAIAAAIKKCTTSPDYLPPLRMASLGCSECPPMIRQFMALVERCNLRDAPAAFAEACLDSPWVQFLPASCTREFAARTLLRANMDDPEETFMAKLAMREHRFMFNEKNWPLIDSIPSQIPFLFEFEGSDKMDDILGAALGFDPRILDLTRCAVTGSVVAFALRQQRPDITHKVVNGRRMTRREYKSSELTLEPPADMGGAEGEAGGAVGEAGDAVGDAVGEAGDAVGEAAAGSEAAAIIDDTPIIETCWHKDRQLARDYDIDIVVFARRAEFEKIVTENCQRILKLRPGARVVRRPNGTVAVVSTTLEDFARFPPIEFFPGSIAHVCSHHLGPVRACFTQYAGTHAEPVAEPRFYATASAIRAAVTRQLDDFNYFASRKTFPQEIIAKYLSREYRLSRNAPVIVRVEVANYEAMTSQDECEGQGCTILV